MSLLTCPRCAELCAPDATHCGCGATLVLGFVDNGYWHVRAPHHPMAQRSGKARLHRLVAAEAAGRLLDPDEVVHHINEDKLDNQPENLLVCPDNGEHRRLHRRPT